MKSKRSDYFHLEYLWMNKLFELARGDYIDRSENVPFFYRAVVVAVDTVGGKLENPSGEGMINAIVDGNPIDLPVTSGPNNPMNSVKARIISGEIDQYRSNEELRVYWPMTQEHDMIPIKPGEYVYVSFEGENYEHALWMGKVPGHSNLNFYRGSDAYSTYDDKRLKYAFEDVDRPDNKDENNDIVASGRLALNKLKGLFF